jgi:Flp pilus assembly pilin Flp
MPNATQRAAARAWANTRVEALRQRRDEGQGSVEYLGVIILVALIIIAIVSTGIQDDIANGLKTAVSKITGAG